jgi:nucleoside-diphosphate-sugar epimerase
VEYASQHLFFDNSKSRNELGLVYSPVEESLREAVKWFKEHGYL